MQKYDPITSAARFPEQSWLKATASDANGTGCVTVNMALKSQGIIGLRDSKQPEVGAFVFDLDEWAGFLHGAKNGEFDL
ncbi:DUF397 domain-containing protein [Actinokineospora iranica]|uniref:DUF397 domain-containing protein n=1 Tax=Actinokineospora iranica TaxID=1271860 RepID=A0A1G6PAC9_9PSEU|nr:DUF397 domain-containing protein [Actinokineospora iranica]SDC76377.1 protein of unknown function [Actinokineospora iranica]